MAGLVSMTMVSLGECHEAGEWGHTARLAADEAVEPTLRAWVATRVAVEHPHFGDPAAAAAAAHEAEMRTGTNRRASRRWPAPSSPGRRGCSERLPPPRYRRPAAHPGRGLVAGRPGPRHSPGRCVLRAAGLPDPRRDRPGARCRVAGPVAARGRLWSGRAREPHRGDRPGARPRRRHRSARAGGRGRHAGQPGGRPHRRPAARVGGEACPGKSSQAQTTCSPQENGTVVVPVLLSITL